MTSATPTVSPTAAHCELWLSAGELARRIADRSISSAALVRGYVQQIECVEPKINAVTQRRFAQALQEAQTADEACQTEESLPPLHGIPFTVKELVDVAGLRTGWGCATDIQPSAAVSAPVVSRLQAAGGIVIAKTNVPQLGFFFETDNPVYGRTANPWNIERTCGGSSGGEAAVIACGGASFGIGTDLGGSIRVPAHFCGIHGLMPTAGSISSHGVRCLSTGASMTPMAGPMARHVDDLHLVWSLMREPHDLGPDRAKLVDIEGLRVGLWPSSDYFPASDFIQQHVHRAGEHLRGAGAKVRPVEMPPGIDILRLYLGIVTADGGRTMKAELKGSKVDRRLAKMIRINSLSRTARATLGRLAAISGQQIEADLVQACGLRSTQSLWALDEQLNQFRRAFAQSWQEQEIDVVISPPFGLPATPHGRAMDLVVAGLYAFLPNLLGYPAGVVSISHISHEVASNTTARPHPKDRVQRLASRCEQESGGLPIGLQVIGRPWQENLVLTTMRCLEASAGRYDCQTPTAWQPPLSASS